VGKRETFIIVGQGLAGTFLAWHLLFQRQPFIIVDPDHLTNCSKVAAGIMDPISGQRYFQAWDADRTLPYALAFYIQVSQILKLPFFSLLPSYRLFSSEADCNLFKSKKLLPRVARYFLDDRPPFSFTPPFGGVNIQGSGYMNTALFLEASRDFFSHIGAFAKDTLDYNDLTHYENGVLWQGYPCRGVVFCEGYHSSKNPWFGGLGYNHSKGNILEGTISGLHDHHILHMGKWILPLGKGHFKFGATYDKAYISELPDASAVDEICGVIKSQLPVKITILQHHAGIRPIALDNKPIIGKHPHFQNFSILTAFGSRGVSLGPFYANQLANHLCHNAPIEKPVSALRYF